MPVLAREPFKTGETEIKGQRRKSQKNRIINREESDMCEIQE